MAKVQVGDSVVLNDEGLRIIFGQAWRMARHFKQIPLLITEVATVSYTFPEQTFIVRVNNPEIDENLLFDHCFDQVDHGK